MKKIFLLLSFVLLSSYSYADDNYVQPVINYVTNYGNGTYGITYGYNSNYNTTKNFPIASNGQNKNAFNQAPIDRGQPTSFLPGTVNEVFTVFTSYGQNITWNLTNKSVTNQTKNITCQVTNNAGSNMPGIGGQVTYTLQYNISEGQSLFSSQLIDTLPAGVTYVSCTGGGVHSNGVVKWTLGTLGQGAAGNVTVTVQVASVQPNYRNVGYIVGTMSGATYRGRGAKENVPSATVTTDSSYIAAFEDLKHSGWNDWDVNDFVVGMRERVTFDGSNRVTKLVFDYEALARGSAFVNKFYHLVKLSGNSTATLVVKDSNGVVLPSLGFTNQPFSGNVNVTIFPNTYNALPPQAGLAFTNVEIVQHGVVKGYTATLTITTDGTSNTAANYLRNSSQPYLINELNKQINIASLAGTLGNTQNVDNNVDPNTLLTGYFLDLGYRLPYDWKWPLEGPTNPIWKSFPQFTSYILSGRSTNTAWYNTPDLNKVWTRRVVTDNFPFTGEAPAKIVKNTKSDKEVSSNKYELSQNYPNPFNPTTMISFNVPNNEFVSIKVFDMSGKEVAVLVNSELKAGTYDFNFNAGNLSSGIYFYRVNTPSFSDTKRMILVK
ncbi:MAG: LruC domain-containing protein [Bacteroidetes bacterium]|nr:LruC domain-containing protein [Bacteroidota bacterium]